MSKYYHDLDGTVTQILREYGSLTDLLKNRVHRISLFSSSSSSNIMTIKHIEETSRVFVISSDRIGITELGDNKVMKQTVDDAFIDVIFNFGFHDIGLYEERCEAQLSVRLLDLYILAVVDYIISFIFIKKSFLIGSLPTVGLFVLVECREASIAMQRNSEPSLNVILEIMSNYRCVRFL